MGKIISSLYPAQKAPSEKGVFSKRKELLLGKRRMAASTSEIVTSFENAAIKHDVNTN